MKRANVKEVIRRSNIDLVLFQETELCSLDDLVLRIYGVATFLTGCALMLSDPLVYFS